MPVMDAVPLNWIEHEGGLFEIGHDGNGFSYDCEMPRHKAFFNPFKIATRPVTNSEWIKFIDAGGYEDATLWCLMVGRLANAKNGIARFIGGNKMMFGGPIHCEGRKR